MSFTSNASELSSSLNAMADRIDNPEEPLDQARKLLVQQETDVFAQSGGPLGVHWASAVEPDRKAGSQLLVASGALRASLTGAGAGTVAFDALKFGTDVPYAGYLQFGTEKMVARPFLGVGDELARVLLDRFGLAVLHGNSE